MKNKASNSLLTFIVLVLSFFLVYKIIPNTLGSAEVYEIYTFEDLVKYAKLSRTSGYQDDTYKLMNDITITEENQKELENSDFNYISFGSSDVPFSGIFDGQGYTIYNLSYSADLSVKSDTGLISESSGAVIKNLIISNADVQADYRGGLVVGKATDTLIENVVVKDSHLFVSASDNVLTLITDGGIRGGAVVGEAFNSVLYNCEVDNTIVNTNNTSGVAALSGKGLTLGGIIGKSDNTLIEYSRVLGGNVKNYYDVAVGALGGNTLYVGGIVGQMSNSSKVIDSFSTATLYFYCATYVSVGAGNSGNIGGITAAMNGSTNEIIRSHYAGVATSRQYNAVLVIPIIQDNVNISGIANIYDGGSVVNTYFKSSMNPDVDMKVLGNSTTTSSYGPQSDDRYSSKEFWQSAYYDLNGSVERSSDYDSKHYNRWVMDTDLGIPVHGKAISATLNFKDAGVVTISKSELINNTVSTTDPYLFAVQGFKPSEIMVSINATENDGYRFISWYKKEGVSAWKLDSYDYIEEVLKEEESVSNDKDYNNIIFKDNDLYIAYYQARVLFHDIQGNIINPKTGDEDTESNEDNWYDYNDSFPGVIPTNKPSSDTSSLIGWTTKEGGYSAITTSELNTLKSNGTFYELDDVATQSLSLYPVYADLISNITTIFEGNELDSSSNISLRESVGFTTSAMNDDSKVVISALGYGENNSFPPGYRFLGWYDENNNRVSSDSTFTLNDYDLTEKYTFTAKLEYKVDYYGTTTKFYDDSDFDGNPFNKPSVSVWYEYNELFIDMGSSVVVEQGDTFDGWYLGMGSVPHSSEDYGNCDGVSTSKKITEPFSVHAHVSGDSSSYEIYLISDFPNAGVITTENSPATVEFIVNMTEIKEGYNFLFWASGRDNGNRQETSTSPTGFDSGGVFLSTADYGYEAHFDADVVFHNKTGDVIKTVTRRYQEKVFSNSDITYQYTWPIEQSNIDITISDKNVTNGIHTSEAYPYNLNDSGLQVEDYRFIGWVDKNSLTASEWDYIYGTNGETYSVGSDPYTTLSIPLATPYLLDEDDICLEPMDIYPVYVKYDIVTKTNVTRENLTIDINIPDNPTYIIEENGTLYADITLTPDLDTYVIGQTGEKYVLTSFILVDEEGNKEVIEKTSDGTYKYKVSPDITYTFIANYEPLVVVYHLNDTDIDVLLKTSGDVLGKGKNPTYDIANIMDDSDNMYIFVGWSKEMPTNNKYHKYNNYNEISGLVDESMLVTNSMDLYPVYIKVNINVNTNIDTYIEEKGIVKESIRTITRDSISNVSLQVLNDNIDNYYFVGWYKNYVNDEFKGTLLTHNQDYILEEAENYESITYTAVYKKMYNVNYYGKDGSIIYTTIVEHEDNRTFVKTDEDTEGNLVETPIDYEAILEISNILELNEVFKIWQWVKEDGTIVSWNDFYNKPIQDNMNLYPVLVKTTATDYNGNSVDVTNTPDIILGVSDNTIFAGLNRVYDKSTLTIHVNEIAYNNINTTTSPLEGVNVIVYPHSTTDEDYIGSESTNSNGDAIFNFKGKFTIVKQKDDSAKENDTYIYKIATKDNPQDIVKIIVVKNGESVNVIVPYGEYIVYEDNNWYWRYNSNSSSNLTVNNYLNDKVTFANQINNNKWFDGTNIINNKYR